MQCPNFKMDYMFIYAKRGVDDGHRALVSYFEMEICRKGRIEFILRQQRFYDIKYMLNDMIYIFMTNQLLLSNMLSQNLSKLHLKSTFPLVNFLCHHSDDQQLTKCILKQFKININIKQMNNQANETIFSNLKQFISREVERIISHNLEHKPYDSLRSKDYISIISQQVIERLTSVNKNFKFIVNVILLAKGGNGFDLGGASYYNIDMDGTQTVRWQSKYLTCITQVYGIAN